MVVYYTVMLQYYTVIITHNHRICKFKDAKMPKLSFQTDCFCSPPTSLHATILKRFGQIRICVQTTRPTSVGPCVDERLAAAPFV